MAFIAGTLCALGLLPVLFFLWRRSLSRALAAEQLRMIEQRDISAQKQRETEMADRVRIINDVFDSVPIMLAMRDLDGRFQFVNRAWEAATERKRDEVIGTTPHAIRSAADAETLLELDRAAVARYLARGKDASPAFAPQERTIRSHRFLQSRSVVTDAQGQPTGVIIASIDTTERYRMEQALAAQAAQLERQNEALQENVRLREEVDRMGRHDLKTPLASIIAVPKLLREGRTLSREEEDLLSIVERAGYRLLNMVNLSLDLFKMEEGRYRFAPQAVELTAILSKLALDLASHAQSKGIVVRLPDGPETFVSAEELLCYSMLGNLVKNAIEAAPESGEVTLSIREDGEAGVLLSIHNAGAVPEAVRASFFDKYATAGKSGGTGLGTYSARLMARTQGGDIGMQTSEAEGTTVTVRLTRAPASAARVVSPAMHAEGLAARADALPALRVLVVDDDEYNRLIVRRYLPSPPLTVAMAVNGRSAVDAVEAEPFDVILMDLDMPVLGGFHATARIRRRELANGRRPSIIVALSSHDDEETTRRCLATGFDRYLTKPVTRETLHRMLLDIAAHTATSAAPTRSAVSEAGDPIVLDADLRDELPGFLESRHRALSELDVAVAADDAETARQVAHRLAGSFAMYGFAWAAQICGDMERDARTGDTSRLRDAAAAVRSHLRSAEFRFHPATGEADAPVESPPAIS